MRTRRLGRLMSRGAVLLALSAAALGVANPAQADRGTPDKPAEPAAELLSTDWGIVQPVQPDRGEQDLDGPIVRTESTDWG